MAAGSYVDHPVVSLLDDYSSVEAAQLKRIHGRMLRLGLSSQPYAASRLLVTAVSHSNNLDYALKVFDHIPQPNLYSFNTVIRALASQNPHLALLHLARLLSSSPHSPDNFTFPFAIKAAALLAHLPAGAAIHAMALKSPFRSHLFVLNSLLHLYSACGHPALSYRVFAAIPAPDLVSWNSIIAAFANAGRCHQAFALFRRMPCRPNDVTMLSLLSACGKTGDLWLARSLHSYILRSGIEQSLILINAALDMYTKCGGLEDAKALFDRMARRDSISWTTMLVGYANSGEFDAALNVFDAMPDRDIASWNALISGHEQGGRPKEAIHLFRRLQHGDAEPDQVTLVAALSACAQLGALEQGCWIHAYMEKRNFRLNCHLTTSLIDMYSKCGDLEKALDVFVAADRRDVFVWSAMIGGLAMHGRGAAALDLFSQMKESKVMPNGVTFMNVLCACSHAGLVDEGRLCFSQMEQLFGVTPTAEHYGCMVDLLARAGLLKEACETVENMPMPPRASIWVALLGACVVHKHVGLGEHACKRLLQLEPGNDGAYVLLSNLYAKSGNWDGVSKLRKLMKDARLRKEPGCSSIEVGGVVHEFLVGDASHPMSEKIYSQLDEIKSRLKAAGYVPDRAQLLQDIEEEDAMDQALYLHSEKLAIAFGLISTDPPAPIRISKNLRVCEDCHSAAKFISSVYSREIFLRDRYRFHHFRDGFCSCMDYW